MGTSGRAGQQTSSSLPLPSHISSLSSLSSFKTRSRINLSRSLNIYCIKMAHTRRNPPFRAEHLGSLLRPKELLQKRALFEKNELSQIEVTKAEDEAIEKVVKVQADCGFRAISDGEYRLELGTPGRHNRYPAIF
jgi:hypothetical protein